MKRLLLYLISCLFFSGLSAQIVKQGEHFTKVTVIDGKVTFLKEIPLKKELSINDNHILLKKWAADNYGKDPFISSIRYDPRELGFIAKSRIELILPVNSKSVKESIIMRYRINGFIHENKCVLQITDISYLYENSSRSNTLSRVTRAEDFITDKSTDIDDSMQELKINTKKSTLFFLNNLAKDFEERFGY